MKEKIVLFLILVSAPFFIFQPARAITEQERQDLIYQIQQQIIQIQQQINQMSSGGVSWCRDFNYNIKYNSFGNEVWNLHVALKKEGFLISDLEVQNQKFGDSTALAVNAFQEKYRAEVLTPLNLSKATGSVGAYTRNKLNKIYGCTPVCVSFWTCSDWGSCSSNKQKRTCKDSKSCAISLNKPAEIKDCVVPKLEISGNGKKGKVSINAGETVLISWISDGVVSCSASGNWSGPKNISGSEKTDPLNLSKAYNLSCKDVNGNVIASSIDVQVSQLKADIKANNSDGPVTIDLGKTASLSWTSSGADRCSGSGNWSGDKSISGSELSGYFSYPREYVYTIYCRGPSGGAQDSVTINVPTPKIDIKANNSDGPITIGSGRTASLSWTSTGVYFCVASGDWSGSRNISGSESTAKILSSKIYVIACKDVAKNEVSDSVRINIKP